MEESFSALRYSANINQKHCYISEKSIQEVPITSNPPGPCLKVQKVKCRIKSVVKIQNIFMPVYMNDLKKNYISDNEKTCLAIRKR